MSVAPNHTIPLTSRADEQSDVRTIGLIAPEPGAPAWNRSAHPIQKEIPDDQAGNQFAKCCLPWLGLLRLRYRPIPEAQPAAGSQAAIRNDGTCGQTNTKDLILLARI